MRDAFLERGHDAISCDTEPSDVEGPHYRDDALSVLKRERFDMLIAFPPCTHLAASGARWWPEKRADGRQALAVAFARALLDAHVERIALENPVGFLSKAIRKPDQIIQPWQFGHGETKATCLWLKNLPLLRPTCIVDGREARVHRMSPGPDRGRLRSLTYPGIAQAMAAQWG